MAIAFVGAAAGVDSVAIPAHQPGDMLLIFAYRDDSNTQPTQPAGWTQGGAMAGNTNSGRVAWRIATTSAETSGTWNNATTVIVAVYRASSGQNGIGTVASAGAASTTVTYPALPSMSASGTSWVVGMAGHRSINTALETPPPGMVLRINAVDGGDEASLFDTNGPVVGWAGEVVSVGGSSSGWRSFSVELTLTSASVTGIGQAVANISASSNGGLATTGLGAANSTATTGAVGSIRSDGVIAAVAMIAAGAAGHIITAGEAWGEVYPATAGAAQIAIAAGASVEADSDVSSTADVVIFAIAAADVPVMAAAIASSDIVDPPLTEPALAVTVSWPVWPDAGVAWPANQPQAGRWPVWKSATGKWRP